jgi:hypothetical protein
MLQTQHEELHSLLSHDDVAIWEALYREARPVPPVLTLSCVDTIAHCPNRLRNDSSRFGFGFGFRLDRF